MQLLTKKTRTVVISITSLIDVVLLLLIFFMLTTSFVEQPGMKLDLPETESNAGESTDELTVTISSESEVYLGTELIELENLKAALIKHKDEDNTSSLVIKADKTTPHGTVVKVMDIAKISGLEKLIIASEKVK
ncbi:MAG: biopolymer transporter ExbD [Candidatus Cloacimonetes bacterium]|jgi:biopolymer transport protein ExbD|nr:biopolymer transporter ExbD [Candidatus Cloacimonadota bacterium]